jgi:transposase
MAGLSIRGRIFKKCFEGSVNSEKLIQGLEHFRRCMGGPFMMIWDRSRTHRSKLTKAYLADHLEIHVEPLPAYAPETNPEEFCHGNIKRSIKNTACSSKPDIPQILHKKFAALRKRHALLLACFHHAGLALNQLW